MFDIIYEDQDLRVYNKPADISLLRDRSGRPDFWQALQASGEKPYMVHRLDKGTSGVLLVARRQRVQSELTRAFNAQTVSKYYLAWVTGLFPCADTYRITLPLCKGRKSRYRVAGNRVDIKQNGHNFDIQQDRQGVAAVTLARGLIHSNEKNPRTLLLLRPLSGRTHQLRVHMSWLGFPILGDHLYGKPNDPAQTARRLMLHCHRIVVPGRGSFTAPISGANFPARAPGSY